MDNHDPIQCSLPDGGGLFKARARAYNSGRRPTTHSAYSRASPLVRSALHRLCVHTGLRRKPLRIRTADGLASRYKYVKVHSATVPRTKLSTYQISLPVGIHSQVPPCGHDIKSIKRRDPSILFSYPLYKSGRPIDRVDFAPVCFIFVIIACMQACAVHFALACSGEPRGPTSARQSVR